MRESGTKQSSAGPAFVQDKRLEWNRRTICPRNLTDWQLQYLNSWTLATSRWLLAALFGIATNCSVGAFLFRVMGETVGSFCGISGGMRPVFSFQQSYSRREEAMISGKSLAHLGHFLTMLSLKHALSRTIKHPYFSLLFMSNKLSCLVFFSIRKTEWNNYPETIPHAQD